MALGTASHLTIHYVGENTGGSFTGPSLPLYGQEEEVWVGHCLLLKLEELWTSLPRSF